jgi:hypothetical protein
MTNGEMIAKKILQLYKDEIPVQIAKVIDAKDRELSQMRAALEIAKPYIQAEIDRSEREGYVWLNGLEFMKALTSSPKPREGELYELECYSCGEAIKKDEKDRPECYCHDCENEEKRQRYDTALKVVEAGRNAYLKTSDETLIELGYAIAHFDRTGESA